MVKRAVAILLSLCALLLVALSLCLPFPKKLEGENERYDCLWENGNFTQESYASAFYALEKAEERCARLSRDGARGEISLSQEYVLAYQTLESSSLAQKLALHVTLNRLETACLLRAFGDTLWYDGGRFIWNGKKVVEKPKATAEKFILLGGTLSASALKDSKAKRLYLQTQDELSYRAFVNCEVEEVFGVLPYSVQDGAIFYQTPFGKRLVAALPNCISLTVDGYDFADKGALLPCRNLTSLTLPFVGNTRSFFASEKDEAFAYLFCEGETYRVPTSLKQVTVAGGKLTEHAFYGCEHVEEITVCTVAEENISSSAFLDCTSLKRLHAPKTGLLLNGNFTTSTLPCGCTLYERK